MAVAVLFTKRGKAGRVGSSVATLIGRFKQMDFLIHLTPTWKDNIGLENQGFSLSKVFISVVGYGK